MQLALNTTPRTQDPTIGHLRSTGYGVRSPSSATKRLPTSSTSQPSQLTDALLERERKDVKAKWFDVVLAMQGLPFEMKAEWIRLQCEALDFEMPKPKQKKTEKQQLAEMREFLASNAPALLSLFEKGTR
jgi:hypothetical protein